MYGAASVLSSAELFGTRIRYSGASLGYQLCIFLLAGGLAPLIATASAL